MTPSPELVEEIARVIRDTFQGGSSCKRVARAVLAHPIIAAALNPSASKPYSQQGIIKLLDEWDAEDADKPLSPTLDEPPPRVSFDTIAESDKASDVSEPVNPEDG
jgi:hypothetical protein